jgi:hypothetical protein
MKFRKKPVTIEAMRLEWPTWNAMCEFVGVGFLSEGKPEGCFLDETNKPLPPGKVSQKMGILIPTLEGLMIGREGDWIIRGVKGEFYPCKADIFEATYDPVTEPDSVSGVPV